MCALYAHAYYSHMCMSADDARWRICADNAHLMRIRAFCVYYARMRILRILCADAHSAHVRMCGAAQRAHMRSMRTCAGALPRRMRRGRDPSRKGPKCIIFLRILEREGDSGTKAWISGPPRRKMPRNESREAYPCHTLQTAAARTFAHEGGKRTTHAQRRDS